MSHTLKDNNIYIRHINALVEYVDSAHDINVAIVKITEHPVPFIRRHRSAQITFRIDGSGVTKTSSIDPISHRDSVIDSSAKNNCLGFCLLLPGSLQFVHNRVVPLRNKQRPVDLPRRES